ncbi:MAG: type I DNA topoisomerase [Helicobacteraceae bacterium]|nr:type I DNA topoisomerase [Helicobacteraceae bacterium]
MKRLIIVESPSKARTIKSFLERDDQVVASKGHIRDLPKRTMGITIKDGRFEPQYEISKDHAKQVDEIKSLAKKAEKIYIATDEDREGEAIGWHIAALIGGDAAKFPRIVFHEITRSAIKNALANPRAIDLKMVNAQQARRLLDRLVGYNLSPLLAQKIQRGLSAGRVQSAALKIIVDREREIRAFKQEEYWVITGVFDKKIEAELISFNGEEIEKMSVTNAKQAEKIKETLLKAAYKIGKIEKKERKVAPFPPFMTSSLQQAASSKLGFAPKRTMGIAQKLYEGVPTDKGESGVITYMRTDSLNVAPEAIKAAREAIGATYGDTYLSANERRYKTKSKGAQEAHEAIRPTNIAFTPAIAAKYLGRDELKLYALIYNRFLATQMSEAVFENVSAIFESDKGVFRATGRKLLFDGFYKVSNEDEDKDKLLPELKSGAAANLSDIKTEQKFTEPPAKFSEAGLIKELEKLGIGRPSTYAPTLSILEERDYIHIEKKRIEPQEIAFNVIAMLEKHFPEIVDSGFTAKVEEELDQIEESGRDWQEILAEFYEPFIAKVKAGKSAIESQKVAEEIDENCPKCGLPLVKRKGRFGEFISCSGYPKCKYSRNILSESESAAVSTVEQKCEKCGSPMAVKRGRNGLFLACTSYPKCKNAKPLPREGEKHEKIETPCPKCGGEIRKRTSKRGDFYGCSNYPKCDFIAKFAPTSRKCDRCGYPMALRTLRGEEIYECVNSECKNKEKA